MRSTRITLPELALIAGTRGALGMGLGLLLADRFSDQQRRAIGWTLVTVGILTTIPLGIEVFGGGRISSPEPSPGAGGTRPQRGDELERTVALAQH